MVADGQRQPDAAAHMEKMANPRAPDPYRIAMRQGDNLNKTPRELHAWLGEALQNGSVRILNAPLHNTSSTQIRANLAKTHHSDGLPQPVAQYIRQHKLYEK